MMLFNKQTDDARLNAASIWHARLHAETCADATRQEFLEWLKASAANRAAFDLVENVYGVLDEAGNYRAVLRASGSLEENARSNDWHGIPKAGIRIGSSGLALLAACLIVAFGVARLRDDSHPTIYATRIGETRNVALEDGSIIEMNTDSAIAVRFNDSGRHVTLDHGEATFRVRKDSARPFLLTVGDRIVRDIGTIFDVFHDSNETVVTVSEGLVDVSFRAAGHGNPTRLSVGDQLVAQEGSETTTLHHVDPTQAMTWRQGYLTYNDAPLSRVVKDLNRYFPGRILLEGPDAGRQRFSGLLKIDDEEAVLNRLKALLPMTTKRGVDGSVTLSVKLKD